jgi:hypothetical protein
MEHISLEQSVEIILTPEFYTHIREELDIRFAYQAKQIAAALFDDYLDSTKEYQYHVTKCENDWCFYAYDIKQIEDFIEDIGLEKHRISRIYFAQELSSELENPLKLSDNSILQTIESTVTLIPARLMEANVFFQSLDLSKVKLNSGVSIAASHNSFISLKETILLGSIFFILGTIFIFEGSRIKSSISKDNERLIQLLDANPSYGSSMIRQNILNKYQPIDRQEKAKRQSIKDISKLLSAKSELTSLNIEKLTIKANIKTSNTEISKQVVQNAKAKNFKSSTVEQNVKVEKSI